MNERMENNPTQELKNKRRAHVKFMSTEANKNIYELGYPFAYFEKTCQFAIKTPIGMVDYFCTNGTWVVRKNQDRGRGLKKLKKYLEQPFPTREAKKTNSNQSWMKKMD